MFGTRFLPFVSYSYQTITVSYNTVKSERARTEILALDEFVILRKYVYNW